MLVGVTGFGSVWRRRVRSDPGDSRRFARAAYFNTTGIMVNGTIVRHRKIAGHVRFNAAGGFNGNYPDRMVGKVFECDGPCIWNGQNKVFFRRRVPTPVRPDCFLVSVRSQEHGHVHVGTEGWKSEKSFLISFSEWRDRQEAMLLMPCGNWVRTELGRVVLMADAIPWRASLNFKVND